MQGRLVSEMWTHDPAEDYVPAKFRRACEYDSFVPSPISGWNPDLTGELAGIASDAQQALAELSALDDPALRALARLLLRTEAISSSKIEGMQVGVREFARAEAKHDLGGKVGSEALEILAGIDAMQFAIDEAALDTEGVSRDRIREIHRHLMAQAADWASPGEFRTVQNWIGGNDYNPCGADFVPPPPNEVDALLDDLALATSEEHLPAIVQCAVVHAQFETIHPFNDGNGRVGRALLHVLLRRRQVIGNVVPPFSIVLAKQRERYIDALTRFRHGDVTPWVELFSTAVATSVRIALRYADAVRLLQEQWRTQIRSLDGAPRSDAAVWTLIDHLPAYPVITGPTAVTATGRSKPAVNQAIEQLVNAGVLFPLSSGARNRSWEVDGMLELIEALERGD